MNENSCLTYFKIEGELDPEELAARLGVTACHPFKSRDQWERTSRRRTLYIGYNTDYDVNINKMIKRTITPLVKSLDLLCELRDSMKLKLSLIVVPRIYTSQIKPILSLDEDIISFLFFTQASYDLDYYVYP